MNRAEEALILGGVMGVMGLIARKRIRRELRQAKQGWKENPARMASQIVVSFVVGGQAVWWIIGSDQLGFFMDPKWRFGIGPAVGQLVYTWLPHTAQIAWGIKALEITTDALRVLTDGAVYRRHGISTDVVVTAVTPTLWIWVYEVSEKLVGVFLYSGRVEDPAQVIQSLANIYGNLVRFGIAIPQLLYGEAINRVATDRLERGIKYVARKARGVIRSRRKDED